MVKLDLASYYNDKSRDYSVRSEVCYVPLNQRNKMTASK
jgi:hypothetical protein